MRLSSLLSQLPHLSVSGDTQRTIKSIQHDSRLVGEHDIFVAIQGANIDGRQFAPNLNAAAVIADAPVQTQDNVSCIYVENARLALAQCAAILAGAPAESMAVVGITGTNGKTTTSWLLEQLLCAHKISCGIIGTLSHRIDGVKLKAAQHTTPEASTLQPLLATMHEQKCKCAIMEVSSIGLDLHRVDAIPFRVAVFTNFSRDHLDFHDSLEDYFNAKKRLFTELLHPKGLQVINTDDPKSAELIVNSAHLSSYGLKNHSDYRFSNITSHVDGFEAQLESPSGQWPCNIPLSGRHNLYNLLAAIIVAEHLGCPLESIVQAIPSLTTAPGRLEPVPSEAPFRIYTDYAHTPDALEHVLNALREQCSQRLILVFGCGGDRDKGKRGPMGQIAQQYADIAIVTSDNPRSEEPDSIIDDICHTMVAPVRIVNRRDAIQRALTLAEPNDFVLIAGKGHEHYQEINGVRRPFDDRAVAQTIIRELLI